MSKFAQILQEKVHVSWLIASLCVGYILGVAVAPIAGDISGIPLLFAAIVLYSLSLFRRTKSVLILCVCAGILCGLVRGSGVQERTNSLQPYYGKTAIVAGIIVDDPTVTAQGGQRVVLRDVSIDSQSVGGKIWVDSPAQTVLKRSDTVTFEGKLSEGFGTMGASMFRARLVGAERTKHGDIGLELRDWFATAIRQHIPSPEADLGVGYLVGQRSTLPVDLDEKLQLLGLTHVVVASGYNLTILVRFARRAFVKKSKYLATMAASGMIAGFVLITGFSPSMSRAALVTALSLLVWYYGRRIHPLVLLPFAAAVTLVIKPSYIWGDIGWYLSFISFAGIMIVAPLIRTYFFGDTQPPLLVGIFIETMSAVLATLPLIAFIFGQYSLLALPANMLILPFVPLAMACTFIAGLCAVTVPPLAIVAAWPAEFVLRYMTYTIDWLGAMPGAGGSIQVGVPVLVGGYVFLILGCVWLARKTSFTFKCENIVL
jgi:competence protein ComEC